MDGGSWHCRGDKDQDHPQGKKMQKSKNGCLRRPYKYLWKEVKRKAKEKRKDIPIWLQSSREQQGDKKAFLSEQCTETEKNSRMGKTKDLLKKIRDTKRIFHAKMGTIKDRNGMDLTEAEDNKN